MDKLDILLNFNDFLDDITDGKVIYLDKTKNINTFYNYYKSNNLVIAKSKYIPMHYVNSIDKKHLAKDGIIDG